MERLTTDQAADRLGISVDAVRGRIKRGTLEHEREGNKVYVLLGTDHSGATTTSSDESTDQSSDQARPDELVEVLTDQVEHLREQLAEEREARRRADTIIAQLAQSNEEQARTIRAIEAPDSPRDEQNEGQETPGPGPEGSHTPESEATGEGNIERGGTHRGLWRRIFGRGW
jgi:excisionase family DNA binding protein